MPTPVFTTPGAQIPITQDLMTFSYAVTGGTMQGVATKTPDGTTRAVGLAFVANSNLPNAKFTSINVTTGALAAGTITGANNVYLMSTNATPGNQQVRSAAQMLADTNQVAGYSYTLRITNTGAGTLTLVADAGATVTLTGTMTVPQNTFRDFVVTFPTTTTAVIQATGVGTYS